ncbi:restriction endonuclease subunit M [Aliarcobacter butzleri]|uniref:restriction endonuclease subunit M n=1 Tax=Aliarcobacter butzleri TaxID=28197 RepID=UPI00263EE5AD|nr:N-6 DNA methylase [Aliarcobacter butzleri]MDN5058243.1 N-6 DNA methylase [Aliarcobacter butzleri]
MKNDELISLGIKKDLIKFDEGQKYITYIHQNNKKRNFTNPEEIVQAEAYLKLILNYGYPKENISMFQTVKMASSSKEADIIVYHDLEHTKPHIVVECKHEDVSDQEFNQAIEQAASYAYALAGTIQYIWVVSSIEKAFKIDKDSSVKQTIPDIPRYGKTEVQKYKYAKGGRLSTDTLLIDETKQNFFDLETIQESELTKRFKQAHNALWAGGELNPSSAFDELDKLIFCKIWDERKKGRKKGDPYDFQIFSLPVPKNATDDEKKEIENKITTELFDRVVSLYNEGKKEDPEVFKDDIRLTPTKVKTVVSYLEDINLSATDLDSKGKAFETFMGSYFRGDFGQFFTPRNIVKFIVNCLPITYKSKVLDTSCGSGGFLLYAMDKVRKEADLEYPEQIANVDKGIVEGKDHYNHWHNFASNRLFGIEINEQISRTAKMNMIIHDDGHTNVISSDGLLKSEVMIEKSGNKGFEYGTFDFIITNPPFGSTIKQTESAYLHQYSLGNKDVSWLDTKNSVSSERANQSTEVLFIEQDYNFLVEGGFLAIVIPDGILTNSSMQYVRDNIEEWFRIVAVVSMPQTAFSHTGAGVKSSVLFLRKWSDKTTEAIKNQKKSIQDELKIEHNYLKQIQKIEDEKKAELKTFTGDKKSEEFKEFKNALSEKYTSKINNLKDELEEIYLKTKQLKLKDYPIFMAIAEDIGFDATGRATGNNELEVIERELTRFINHIIKSETV